MIIGQSICRPRESRERGRSHADLGTAATGAIVLEAYGSAARDELQSVKLSRVIGL